MRFLLLFWIGYPAFAATEYDVVKKNFDGAAETVLFDEIPDFRERYWQCQIVTNKEPNHRFSPGHRVLRLVEELNTNDPIFQPKMRAMLTGPSMNAKDLHLTSDQFFNSSKMSGDGTREIKVTNHSKWKDLGVLQDVTYKIDLWVRKNAKGVYMFKLYNYENYMAWSGTSWEPYNWEFTAYGYCWK